MRPLLVSAVVVVVLTVASQAWALPRFAARNGMDCMQCHVNPTGGGIRNGYGRNVFEHVWLPMASSDEPASWVAGEIRNGHSEEGGDGEENDPAEVQWRPFSGDLTERLSIGADFRLAYIFIRPDKGPEPGIKRQITNTFFLMQADLYHSARLNEHLTLVLDVGIYSGFEAWGLFQAFRDEADYGLFFKVGRFLPPFGIREVEHQLFTRDGVGLGAVDRDAGIEATAFWGPLALNVALLNGTLGATLLDSSGLERRTFEKAIASRLSARAELGPLRSQLGLSYYFNQNVNQANPLFGSVMPDSLQASIGDGVDEDRAGVFLTANLGRFTYIGDLVYVRDRFASGEIPKFEGYASYQELSFVATQGLEVIATFEFKEPDIKVLKNSTTRAGLVIEFFPWAYTEFRLMSRRTWDEASPTKGSWDVVLFAHLFM